jgi:NADPH-dependent 7-cyano-7-deazaguanine reductase QueF-like protein
VQIECPSCSGSGCGQCRDGLIEITACPLAIIGADIWRAIEFADLYAKGLPPVAGGVLQQSNVFIEAARFIWREQAYWKTRLRLRNE